MSQLQLTDLSKGLNFSLEEILIKGLRNDQKIQKVDNNLEFTRSISTMTLYSKKGLEIYEEITKTEVSLASSFLTPLQGKRIKAIN